MEDCLGLSEDELSRYSSEDDELGSKNRTVTFVKLTESFPTESGTVDISTTQIGSKMILDVTQAGRRKLRCYVYTSSVDDVYNTIKTGMEDDSILCHKFLSLNPVIKNPMMFKLKMDAYLEKNRG